MNRDQTQLQAAHDLGEAILRFIQAIDFPGMEVDRTHSKARKGDMSNKYTAVGQ